MSRPFTFSRRRFLQYTGGFSALQLAASMDKLGVVASAQPGDYKTLADNPPIWSVNPFAIAELMIGEDLSQKKGWAEVQAVLQQAFKTSTWEAVFEPGGALDILQDLALFSNVPPERRKRVEEAIKLYGEEPILRVLPYLSPGLDASSAGPGAALPWDVPPDPHSWRDIDIDASDKVADGISYLDPEQGVAIDCYLISAMIALAWCRPDDWAKKLRQKIELDAVAKRYSYTFHGEPHEPPVAVRPRLPVAKFKNLEKFAYARSSTNTKEAWPGMLEKAFVMRQWRNANHPIAGERDLTESDYMYISTHRFKGTHEACQVLDGGGREEAVHPFDSIRALECFDQDLVTTWPTGAWTFTTYDQMNGAGPKNAGLIKNHAYAVLGLKNWNGADYVILRDPHGVNLPISEPHLNGVWNPPGRGTQVVLNDKGVFGLRSDWFEKAFWKVGWVKG